MDKSYTQHFKNFINYLKAHRSKIIKGFAGVGLAFFVFILAIYLGFFGSLPSKKALSQKRFHQASEVYSEDGVLLGKYFLHEQTNIKLSQVPTHVINALIATEDVRFYKHEGTDASSLMRVFFKTLLLRNSASGGGSTISQQLAKCWYPRKEFWFLETPINKVREMIIAQRIEDTYTKDQILEHYFNAVHMGGNNYGIAQGARVYFDKDVEQLTIQEGAVLVGMLKASTRYSPLRNPSLSRDRRNVVLQQMAKYNYLPIQDVEQLKESPLVTHQGKNPDLDNSHASYFREMLKKDLAEWCDDNDNPSGENYSLYHDGLKIYTTIDSRAQLAAEKAVLTNMYRLQNVFDSHWNSNELWANNKAAIENAVERSHRYQKLNEAGWEQSRINENFATPIRMTLTNPYSGKNFRKTLSPLDSIKYYLKYLNAGFMAMEPATGKIKAWVGGINQKVYSYDHVLSKRQVGSTFKPILYAAALEDGLKPCTQFQNELRSYDGWTPHNADEQYGGSMSMVQALAQSVNTVSAQLIDEVGVRKTKNMAEDLGIESELPDVPSLALGTAEASLLEMVNAYATLANEGVKRKPYYLKRITDFNGKELDQFDAEDGEQVVEAGIAQTIIEMMKAVINFGSGRALRETYGLRMDIAGKTGTTQNQGDGWFIGVVPNLVAGAWVGGESANIRFRSLALGQGAKTALPIWGDFIQNYSSNQPSYSYAMFRPVSSEIQNNLQCMQEMMAPTPAPAPIVSEKKGFFRSIFRGKGKGRKKSRGKGKNK